MTEELLLIRLLLSVTGIVFIAISLVMFILAESTWNENAKEQGYNRAVTWFWIGGTLIAIRYAIVIALSFGFGG